MCAVEFSGGFNYQHRETQEQQGSQVRLVLQEKEERGEREEILVMMDSLERQ